MTAYLRKINDAIIFLDLEQDEIGKAFRKYRNNPNAYDIGTLKRFEEIVLSELVKKETLARKHLDILINRDFLYDHNR